jgi:hypothetical protein
LSPNQVITLCRALEWSLLIVEKGLDWRSGKCLVKCDYLLLLEIYNAEPFMLIAGRYSAASPPLVV